MATIVWTGGDTIEAPHSGAWSVSANWNGGVVPSVDDDVYLDGAAPYSIDLSESGSARTVTIGNPDAVIQLNGYSLTAATISNGGTIGGGGSIYANITGSGTIYTNGHTVTIAGTISGDGKYIVSGGEMYVNGQVDTSGTDAATFGLGAGTLKFGDFAVGAVTIQPIAEFEGPAGTLDLSSLGAENLTTFGKNVLLQNMFGSDAIEINGAARAIYSNGSLQVYGENDNLLVSLNFHGTAPAQNGTIFSVSDSEITICFMAGTSIATPDGDRAVEILAINDVIMTADGMTAQVRWIGRQTVSTKFADPLRVLPIRIRAGALGENQPMRDLLVSPGHAVFMDGILVLAGALVNDTSIVRETNVPSTFTCYHVELADHSLLLAEGVPAKTFIDNVDRMGFDNWAEREAPYPHDASLSEIDLPLAKSYRQIPLAGRKRLADRAIAFFGVAAVAA